MLQVKYSFMSAIKKIVNKMKLLHPVNLSLCVIVSEPDLKLPAAVPVCSGYLELL